MLLQSGNNTESPARTWTSYQYRNQSYQYKRLKIILPQKLNICNLNIQTDQTTQYIPLSL